METGLAGWGGRTRTSEWRNQNPLAEVFVSLSPGLQPHENKKNFASNSAKRVRFRPCLLRNKKQTISTESYLRPAARRDMLATWSRLLERDRALPVAGP